MAVAEDVDLEEFVMAKDELSGADIKVQCRSRASLPLLPACVCSAAGDAELHRGVQAMCTEAGLLALRERRMRVTQDDFRKAKETALYKKKGNIPEGLYV
jgi:26S proteasome regulatory subunit T2